MEFNKYFIIPQIGVLLVFYFQLTTSDEVLHFRVQGNKIFDGLPCAVELKYSICYASIILFKAKYFFRVYINIRSYCQNLLPKSYCLLRKAKYISRVLTNTLKESHVVYLPFTTNKTWLEATNL